MKGQRLATRRLFGDAHQRVVTGNRADQPAHSGTVDCRCNNMGASGWRSQHDDVGRNLDLGNPFAEYAAKLILRRDARRLVLRDRVDRLPSGHPHLDRTEILQVARHGGLRGADPLVGQQVDQLRLVRDRVLADQLADDLLTLHLARHQRAPIRKASAPRAACSRLWACWITKLRGPSMTSAMTSKPRYAGRQW